MRCCFALSYMSRVKWFSKQTIDFFRRLSTTSFAIITMRSAVVFCEISMAIPNDLLLANIYLKSSGKKTEKACLTFSQHWAYRKTVSAYHNICISQNIDTFCDLLCFVPVWDQHILPIIFLKMWYRKLRILKASAVWQSWANKAGLLVYVFLYWHSHFLNWLRCRVKWHHLAHSKMIYCLGKQLLSTHTHIYIYIYTSSVYPL